MGDDVTGQSPHTDSAFESSAASGAPSTSTQQVSPPRILDSLQWDKQLRCIYFNSDELNRCQTSEPGSEWSSDFTFPSPEELRDFAKAAYKKANTGDLEFGDWKLVMTAQSSVLKGTLESFFANVYLKPKGNQLIVAIKGTTKSKLADLLADLKNVFLNKGGLQVDSVFTFGEELRKLIEKFKCKPQVNITGHSLGGFLAQVLTFTLRNCGIDAEGRVVEMVREDFGLNTTVFDSPAAFKQIKRIAKNDPLKASSFNLPITNFVIKQNKINNNSWMGPHVGIVISLSAEEDLKASSKWYVYRPFDKHGLKNFENVNLDEAFQVIRLRAADLVNYDSKRIPLFQFSQREQDALRLLPLTKTVHMNSVKLVPSSSFTIQDNEVRLIEDQGATTFIPRLRLFVQINHKSFRDLADNLNGQFSMMMHNLLNAHAKDFKDLDLRLKPEIAQKYQKLANGTTIEGLDDEKEQMLFARVIKNSIDRFLFLKYDDFVGVEKLQRETWLRLHQGTLMLCQANGQKVAENLEFSTRIIYLDCASITNQQTFDDTKKPNEIQMPLQVSDLDVASRLNLEATKLRFRGNLVKAAHIFHGLFDSLKVLQIIEFHCEMEKENNEFYFNQKLRNSQKTFGIGVLVNDILNAPSHTFLISSNAGMGKSTNLKKIAHDLQKSRPLHWVVRLELAKFSDSLQNWKENMDKTSIDHDRPTDLDKAAVSLVADEIFKGNMEPNAQLQREVFDAKVDAGQVIFVLDAVDEVCPLHREAVLDVLQQLKKTKLKMLVATRLQEEKEVAEALSIKGYEILRLKKIKEDNQAEFTHQLWASKGISCDFKTAEKLLEELKNYLPNEVPGVPLNLRIIADSFPDGKLTEEFLKHRDLYKLLFEKSINEALVKKMGLNPNDSRQQPLYEKMAKKYYTLLQKVAVAAWFNSDSVKLTQEETDFINPLPFAVVKDGGVRFTHQTFQEYLIAEQLVRFIIGERDISTVFISKDLSKILKKENFERIRAFADTILTHTKCPVISSKEIICEEFLLVCLKEQNLNFFKLFDESIYKKPVGIDKKFPLELILANENPKKEFVEFLLREGTRLEEIINEENHLYILDDVVRGELVQLISEKWKLFKPALNNFDYNPLVTAAEYHSIESAQFLISNGAAINKASMKLFVDDDTFYRYVGVDEDYHTPLSAAIKNDDHDMVHLLIEYGARVDFDDFLKGRDDCLELLYEEISSRHYKDVNGKNLLMKAAARGTPDCVRFLLKKGFDPNEKDSKGQTCLYYTTDRQVHSGGMGDFEERCQIIFDRFENANDIMLFESVMKGHLQMFSFLLERGADLRAVDEDGNTCLHIAAKSMKCNSFFKDILNKCESKALNALGQTPLHVAVEEDCGTSHLRPIDCIKMLLATGADPNAKDSKGQTPLHHYAGSGYAKYCKKLLKAKVEVNSRDNEGMTPLMLAAKNNRSKVVKVLLENGANVDQKDEKGWNCLHHAAAYGNDKCVKILRKKGVPLASKTNGGKTAFKLADESGYKLIAMHLLRGDVKEDEYSNSKQSLEVAIGENDVNRIRTHLENGNRVRAKEFLSAAFCGHLNLLELFLPLVKSVDVKDECGITALMLAACQNHIDCVRFLIEKGADPNEKYKGITSLDLAAQSGAMECIEILFDLVAFENRNLEWLLHSTVETGNLQTLLFLLRKGANLDVLDKWDNTCLHNAATNDNPECLEFLLQNHLHRFDVNARNEYTLTPLHHVARSIKVAHLHLLIQGGADVTVRDKTGQTALHWAAISGRIDNCNFFLEHIPVNSRDRFKKTPLMDAAGSMRKEAPRVLELLLKKGADPTLQEHMGYNSLHHAAQSGRLENVKVLCGRVPLEAQTKLGETALQLAVKGKHTEVVEFLRAKRDERDRGYFNTKQLFWFGFVLISITFIWLYCCFISGHLRFDFLPEKYFYVPGPRVYKFQCQNGKCNQIHH